MGRVRTPTVLQMEAVECGAASLAIILAHFGRWVPLEELRVACGVSRDGSDARMILRAARRYGLSAKAMRYSLQTLAQTPAPFIVFWNFNHFLVVEGFSKDTVFLNDPASGPRRVGMDAFDKSYTGVTLVFEPGADFERSGRPAGVWGTVGRQLAGAPAALAILAITAVLSAVPLAIAAGLARIFVDEVLVAGERDWIPGLVLAGGLTVLVHLVATATLQDMLRKMEAKLAVAGAGRLMWHILRLPYTFFTQRQSGDIVSRIRSNDTAALTVVRSVGLPLVKLLGAVLYVALIAFTNVWIALVTVLFAALSVVATVTARRRVRDASLSVEMDEARVFADTAFAVTSAETIRATGTESAVFVRWAGHHAKALNGEQTLARHVAVLRALPPLTDGIAIATVLVIGAFAVSAGEMTVGSLVAVITLLAPVREPVQALATMLANLETVRAAFARIEDVQNYALDTDFARPTTAAKALKGRSRLVGRIDLRSVTFGYSPLAEPLIRDFSVSLAPGARVALVGGTGSGKSTIAKLIAGLYTPWSGSLLLDSCPPADLPRWLIKTSVGWVDQNVTLFAGTIRDNLTLWDESIPETTLTRAAADAGLYETIALRPGGFDHPVLEGGANFSGGEAQRLQIARALALDPSIVIFDEATSALDPLVEVEIDRNLRRRGCTAVIVAHRLSAIRDCDEIIVLDRGQVVERGTHEDLMRLEGRYRDLVDT